MIVGEKKGNGRGEKREDEREKAGEEGEGKMERSQRLGCHPSCWDLREPVSLATQPAGGQGQTWRREARARQEGRQAKATETWLAGEGEVEQR